jgi:hypothetical protein
MNEDYIVISADLGLHTGVSLLARPHHTGILESRGMLAGTIRGKTAVVGVHVRELLPHERLCKNFKIPKTETQPPHLVVP